MSIEMAGVWKTFGEGHTAVHALKNIDLAAPQGQFVVILGPSGSGKTTLLNLVGAIDGATAGRIDVGGHDLTSLTTDQQVRYRRENVGFVFQFFNLIPTLTAVENVELVADLTGANGAERAVAVLGKVGLADRIHHFPGQLSGGEQQRVAIARATVAAGVTWADEERRKEGLGPLPGGIGSIPWVPLAQAPGNNEGVPTNGD